MPDAVPAFLVEDNRMLSDGIGAMLEAHGFRVVGSARSAADALPGIRRGKPDVVLVSAGVEGSVGVADEVRRALPPLKVIVFNAVPAHLDVMAFIRAGVAGFVLKDATKEEFVRSVRRVADGAHALPRVLAGILFTRVASQAPSRVDRGAKAVSRLTRREREVTELIADGLGNKEIAVRLNIAADTVKSHVHSILEKLALRSRLQIAAFAHTQPDLLTSCVDV